LSKTDLEKLRELTEKLTSREQEILEASVIVENAPDAIIVADKNSEIIFVNNEFCKIFGYKKEEIENKKIDILVPPPHDIQHSEYIKKYLETGAQRILGIRREVMGRKKDGTIFRMYLCVNEVSHRSSIYFIGIIINLEDPIRNDNEAQ